MTHVIGTIASSRPRITGTFDSIASSTSPVSTSVTFSSIPSTYRHLQLRIFANNASSDDLRIRINGDTAGNYTNGFVTAKSGTRTSSHDAAGAITGIFCTQMINAAFFNPIIVDIHDYAVTTKFKTLRINAGRITTSTGTIQANIMSGTWQNTNAINSLTIYVTTNNFSTNSVFALYGIEGS